MAGADRTGDAKTSCVLQFPHLRLDVWTPGPPSIAKQPHLSLLWRYPGGRRPGISRLWHRPDLSPPLSPNIKSGDSKLVHSGLAGQMPLRQRLNTNVAVEKRALRKHRESLHIADVNCWPDPLEAAVKEQSQKQTERAAERAHREVEEAAEQAERAVERIAERARREFEEAAEHGRMEIEAAVEAERHAADELAAEKEAKVLEALEQADAQHAREEADAIARQAAKKKAKQDAQAAQLVDAGWHVAASLLLRRRPLALPRERLLPQSCEAVGGFRAREYGSAYTASLSMAPEVSTPWRGASLRQ